MAFKKKHIHAVTPPVLFVEEQFQLVSFNLRLGLPKALFPSRFYTKPSSYSIFRPTHTCFNHHLSRPASVGRPKNWKGIRKSKLFVMQFSPVCSYVRTARPKYSHQYPVL